MSVRVPPLTIRARRTPEYWKRCGRPCAEGKEIPSSSHECRRLFLRTVASAGEPTRWICRPDRREAHSSLVGSSRSRRRSACKDLIRRSSRRASTCLVRSAASQFHLFEQRVDLIGRQRLGHLAPDQPGVGDLSLAATRFFGCGPLARRSRNHCGGSACQADTCSRVEPFRSETRRVVAGR